MFTPEPIGSLTREQVAEQFIWLDDLRESGLVNMMGAFPLLAEAFSLEPPVAKKVWVAWAESFAARHGSAP
jgi:hypothetical protein